MNDELEAETLRVLAGARRGLAPTKQDAERVLAATRNALRSAVPGAASSEPGPNLFARGPLRPSKLLVLATCLASLSGAVGYVLGNRAAQQSTHAAAAALVVQPPLAVARAAPSTSTPPTQAAAAPEPLPPSAASGAPATHLRQASRPSAAAGSMPPAVSAPAVAADSLEREVRALRRVELALRHGQPKIALVLLDELDRDVPDGKLSEERLAAFVVARCGVGLGSRAALLSEFVQRYPDSMYLARVEQSCAPKTPSP